MVIVVKDYDYQGFKVVEDTSKNKIDIFDILGTTGFAIATLVGIGVLALIITHKLGKEKMAIVGHIIAGPKKETDEANVANEITGAHDDPENPVASSTPQCAPEESRTTTENESSCPPAALERPGAEV